MVAPSDARYGFRGRQKPPEVGGCAASRGLVRKLRARYRTDGAGRGLGRRADGPRDLRGGARSAYGSYVRAAGAASFRATICWQR
jgi:hypothetical protein